MKKNLKLKKIYMYIIYKLYIKDIKKIKNRIINKRTKKKKASIIKHPFQNIATNV